MYLNEAEVRLKWARKMLRTAILGQCPGTEIDICVV